MKTYLTLVSLIACAFFSSCTGEKSGSPAAKTEQAAPQPASVTTKSSGPAADLTGNITFKGKVPPPQAIKMSADPKCNEANKGRQVFSESVIADSKGGLANVVVALKGAGLSNGNPTNSLPPVTLDQNGCMYFPHVVALQVGQTLKILNSDKTMHNVHSVSTANAGFNNAMPNQGQVIEKRFLKPEMMFRVKCDVHPWMTSFISVVDHPYFAVSDSTGKFTLKNVPAGEYTLEAFHEKLGTKSQSVKLEGKPLSVSFLFEGA